MKWNKLGVIKLPFNHQRVSHTQIPVTYEENGIINVLYSSRNKDGISGIYSLKLSPDNLLDVLELDESPILELGKAGSFDDSGLMPTWVEKNLSSHYLYYIGWNKKVSVPYQNSIGLAISRNGVGFKKYSEGPILDRSIHDPCFVGTACVVKEDIWKMWYLSCIEWVNIGDKLEPRYNLKYAESSDGVNWIRNGVTSIDFKSIDEGGIAKASVIKYKDIYHMWFCYRGTKDYRSSITESYRIGYATSKDGQSWNRNDEASGIFPGPLEWDSEMICYPHVFKYKDKLWMLYNGNGFGKDGIGLAELKDD